MNKLTGKLGPFTGQIGYISEQNCHKELIFTSYKNGNPNLHRKELYTGQEARLSFQQGLNIGGCISPDVREIADCGGPAADRHPDFGPDVGGSDFLLSLQWTGPLTSPASLDPRVDGPRAGQLDEPCGPFVDEVEPLGLVPAVNGVYVVADHVGGLDVRGIHTLSLTIGPFSEVRMKVAGQRHPHRPRRIAGLDRPILGKRPWRPRPGLVTRRTGQHVAAVGIADLTR